LFSLGLTVIIAQTNIESGVSFQHFYIDHDARWNIGSAHDVRTTIDMSRGLLHVVFQNNAKRMLADPTGKYLFYKMGDDQHQNLHIYRALSDHPHFSLNYANTTDRVLTVGEKDVFIAVDRNALVLWKFVDGLRTAWLYEGPAVRTGGMVNEFEKIGCVTPSFNDIDGQLLFKIHQVRLMH
uniref:Tripartite motif-containing protein 2 n=1 Tax=Toxocara canis TaxID=6265 RepID=A0A183UJ72_TOXCA